MPKKEDWQPRYWRMVQKKGDDECWPWMGTKNEGGYGRFAPINRRMVYVHRWAYEHFVGPIPEKMEIDHRCFTRHCVNPRHLRLATRSLNGQNRQGPDRDSRTGVRGVYQQKRDGRYIARIYLAGQRFLVGTYDNLAEAERAVVAARAFAYVYSPERAQLGPTEVPMQKGRGVSGIPFVCFHRGSGKFFGTFVVKGRRYHTGRLDTPEQAMAAVAALRQELGLPYAYTTQKKPFAYAYDGPPPQTKTHQTRSGVVGISQRKDGSFCVKLVRSGQRVWLGRYRELERARGVLEQWKREHGEV